ncbi:MAG: 4Fe-4S binding protein [Eubacteriaceae bacterium]|nr:4Fe-4S binding protein [Eubacteriaceae bacterium]
MPKVLKADGMNKCIGCFTCMFICAGVNHQNHSLSQSAIKVKTKDGMQSNYKAVVCLACTGEPACYQACPTGALEKRAGGGVVFKEEKCISCRKCEAACIVGAVHYDEEHKLPVICKHCGVCTRFCPHDCLRMEEKEDVL